MKNFTAFAAAAVVSVVAGITLGGAPAQAKTGECDAGGGGLRLCAYPTLGRPLPGGGSEQFIIGTDSAVWTRWSDSGQDYGKWQSMGGVAKSEVFIESHWEGQQFVSVITHLGTDGNAYSKKRPGLGQEWTAWYKSN